jgi:hypothetical protein
MSQLGQTRKSAVAIVRSGLPPKADSTRTSRHVRKVPIASFCAAKMFIPILSFALHFAPVAFLDAIIPGILVPWYFRFRRTV